MIWYHWCHRFDVNSNVGEKVSDKMKRPTAKSMYMPEVDNNYDEVTRDEGSISSESDLAESPAGQTIRSSFTPSTYGFEHNNGPPHQLLDLNQNPLEPCPVNGCPLNPKSGVSR